MKCPKCQGMMRADTFYGGTETYQGWRCLMCGDIVDPVIFLHRISGDRQIPIPPRNKDVIRLIRKYLNSKPASSNPGSEREISRGV